MMFGGIFMMFFGLVALLLIIALPVLLIVLLVQRPAGFPDAGLRMITPVKPSISSSALCNHCSQHLQSDWAHCPHCGAPTRKIDQARPYETG